MNFVSGSAQQREFRSEEEAAASMKNGMNSANDRIVKLSISLIRRDWLGNLDFQQGQFILATSYCCGNN